MSNMKYCRFQNTVGDFAECLKALEDGEPLSTSEHRAAARLIKLAKRLVDIGEDAYPMLDEGNA